jgi:AGCS family alanine or glycine:cation symporter
MEGFEKWIADASDFVWGVPLLALLFGTHLFLTIRLRFIQRYLGKAIRISLGRKSEGQGDISQFGALTTALAATIGTGNIVGVASAVAAGGPGAVLWMWLTGVFGIATKYSEALLAVHYRVQMPNGQMAGGPMYALQNGLKCRWLGVVFAIFTAIAAFGIGNMVQANSISSLVDETFGPALRSPGHGLLGGAWLGIPAIKWITGLAVTALTAVVILGGIRSIAKVCEALVPFMAIFYVAGCLVLLTMKYDTIPDTLALIGRSAFTGQAALGGFVGAGMKEAIRFGIARGLFSNESGLGSAPIVAAAAQTSDPVRQALVSSTGTFWDTVVVCAITGLVVVNGGEWIQGHNAAALTKATFQDFPVVGPVILVVGLLTFVFSTILGWSYYGEKAIEYLLGTGAIRYYRYLWVAAVMVGSVTTVKTIWNFADIANACMAVPNLVSLIALNGVIVAVTRKYLWNPQESQGHEH